MQKGASTLLLWQSSHPAIWRLLRIVSVQDSPTQLHVGRLCIPSSILLQDFLPLRSAIAPITSVIQDALNRRTPCSPEFSLICQTNIIRQRRTVVKNCGELRETVIQPLLKPPRTTLNVGLIKRAHPSELLPHEGQLRQFVGWKQVWKARLYAVQGTMPFSGVTTSGSEFHRAPDCPIPRINALKRIEGDSR